MNWKRWIPLAVIILLMAAAYMAGLTEYLSIDTIKKYRAIWKEQAAAAPLLASIIYMTVYAVAVALSLPGAVFLTLIGGFLFAQPWCTIYVVTGATTGACSIFLAAKTALGDLLKERAGPLMKKMEAGFQEDATSYLLFLRLVPLFPFWLVNLAPAFFGVGLYTFAWTTFVGIIPGAFVFSQAGTGLGAILDADQTFSIGAILNRDIKIALAALGIFALIPIVIKRYRNRST